MNVDVHLMLEARNYAVKLQQELDRSRQSHYEDVEAVRRDLDEARSQLQDAYAKLDHLQSVLNPAKDAECAAQPRQKNHRP